jgi:hypothetical protein
MCGEPMMMMGEDRRSTVRREPSTEVDRAPEWEERPAYGEPRRRYAS